MSERSVAERLARIEAMLEAALKTKDDHETRMRTLENWRYGIAVALVISTVTATAPVFAK